MARIGVSITKRVLFRGVQQEFSNVYYYSRPALPTSESERDAIIDEIVGKEKTWHSTDVTFVRARLWDASGTPQENEMLRERNLSGTGSTSPITTLDRERAFLIRWPAGKDRLGRAVYLRKYYHSCGYWKGGLGGSPGTQQQTSPLDQASKDAIAADANAVKVVGATVDTWSLCSKNGRAVQGDAQSHTWLEHHQLGDMWR